jgi:hypothetical protein
MTAPVYLSPNMLDKGLEYLKTKCNSVILIDYGYAAGDSYSTVRGTADVNIIASVTGILGTGIVIADQGTLGRKATITAPVSNPLAAKTSSGTSGFLKYVALDTVGSEVLAVWDCTNDQIITINNPVIVPDLVMNFNQPTG